MIYTTLQKNGRKLATHVENIRASAEALQNLIDKSSITFIFSFHLSRMRESTGKSRQKLTLNKLIFWADSGWRHTPDYKIYEQKLACNLCINFLDPFLTFFKKVQNDVRGLQNNLQNWVNSFFSKICICIIYIEHKLVSGSKKSYYYYYSISYYHFLKTVVHLYLPRTCQGLPDTIQTPPRHSMTLIFTSSKSTGRKGANRIFWF